MSEALEQYFSTLLDDRRKRREHATAIRVNTNYDDEDDSATIPTINTNANAKNSLITSAVDEAENDETWKKPHETAPINVDDASHAKSLDGLKGARRQLGRRSKKSRARRRLDSSIAIIVDNAHIPLPFARYSRCNESEKEFMSRSLSSLNSMSYPPPFLRPLLSSSSSSLSHTTLSTDDETRWDSSSSTLTDFSLNVPSRTRDVYDRPLTCVHRRPSISHDGSPNSTERMLRALPLESLALETDILKATRTPQALSLPISLPKEFNVMAMDSDQDDNALDILIDSSQDEDYFEDLFEDDSVDEIEGMPKLKGYSRYEKANLEGHPGVVAKLQVLDGDQCELFTSAGVHPKHIP